MISDSIGLAFSAYFKSSIATALTFILIFLTDKIFFFAGAFSSIISFFVIWPISLYLFYRYCASESLVFEGRLQKHPKVLAIIWLRLFCGYIPFIVAGAVLFGVFKFLIAPLGVKAFGIQNGNDLEQLAVKFFETHGDMISALYPLFHFILMIVVTTILVGYFSYVFSDEEGTNIDDTNFDEPFLDKVSSFRSDYNFHKSSIYKYWNEDGEHYRTFTPRLKLLWLICLSISIVYLLTGICGVIIEGNFVLGNFTENGPYAKMIEVWDDYLVLVFVSYVGLFISTTAVLVPSNAFRHLENVKESSSNE